MVIVLEKNISAKQKESLRSFLEEKGFRVNEIRGEEDTIFGAVGNPHVADMKDINCREFAILAILAVAVLGMGLYPQAFIEVVHQAANDLIAHVAQSKI